MNLSDVAIAFLLWLSAFLGVNDIPSQEDANWTVASSWQSVGPYHYLIAESSTIGDLCRQNPEKFLDFPTVIHGAHEIFKDGILISRFGDKHFQRTRSFYGAPAISCRDLAYAKNVEWRVYSYSKYFARIAHFPFISDKVSSTHFFHETLNIIAAGTLFIIAAFCFIIFYKKVSLQLTLSLVASCILITGYFAASVIFFFNIHISMLSAHKIADTSVWLGLLMFMNILRLENLCTKGLYYAYIAFVCIACLIIITGSSGDEIQFGTTLPFGLTLIITAIALYKVTIKFHKKEGNPRLQILRMISLGFFVAACFNDIFVILGLSSSHVLLSVGMVSGLMFLALSVNENIIATYEERDYLRKNLQDEVDRKTHELKNTLSELKDTQSNLIQSAKLASLGTLSAGIAHEINNSLNYVNGAVKPAIKMVDKLDGSNKDKVKKLLNIMDQGLSMTFDIIESLKNYTGLNQAKVKEVNVAGLVKDVLVILKQKLGEIQLKVTVDESISIETDSVALNQILMNLVTNAVDAMQGKGILEIGCEERSDEIRIWVKDSGSGIDQQYLPKIFDPFFTTKEVGSGQGIGLHLVRRMVDSMEGTITVESQPGEGSTFIICFPLRSENKVVEAV